MKLKAITNTSGKINIIDDAHRCIAVVLNGDGMGDFTETQMNNTVKVIINSYELLRLTRMARSTLLSIKDGDGLSDIDSAIADIDNVLSTIDYA